METTSASRTALGALFIAISVIVAAALLSGAWKKTHPTQENMVSVTGLANEDFQSDLIVWTGEFGQRSMDMKSAFEALRKDAGTIKSYLVSKGVPEKEIVFSAVDIHRDFKPIRNEKGNEVGQEFAGFTLKQGVTIESHQVEQTEAVSREVTGLIDQGVEFYSQPPRYYYTKLADLKIKMLSAATADARLRAEKIATNAKGSLGALRNATMGIFQITGQNSSEEYSYGGAFNTSSKWKTASITVKLEFNVE